MDTSLDFLFTFSLSLPSNGKDENYFGSDDVHLYNARLHSPQPQDRLFACVLFPTDCNHSEVIYVPKDFDRNDFETPVWPEDLDLNVIFPRGAKGIRLRHAPGTTYSLKNEYVMFMSTDTVSALPNRSIAKMFDRYWLGNIVIVKIGRRDGVRVINMGRGEQLKVDDVVGSWLHEYFRSLHETFVADDTPARD